MACSNLAATGLDPWLLIVIGAAALAVGVIVIAFARRRGGALSVTVGIVLIALFAVGAPLDVPAARAAAAECSAEAPDRLSIIQTSTMAGLAPDIAPIAITGRVTNHSTDDTFVVDVLVSIVGITKAPGAVAGVCDATDYVIMSPVMPVGVALVGGGSSGFSGASIGFVDKVTNQDACQGATVRLLYTVG